MELTDKVALITGGKRIGLVVAGQLAARGVDVALGYARSRDEAEQAARGVRAAGRRAEIIQADLSKPAECEAIVNQAVERLGRLDILINMASVYRQRSFNDLTAADWDLALDVDLRATFLCTHAWAAAYEAARRRPRRQFRRLDRPQRTAPLSRVLPYYVAKAGVIALTEALALELASDNILVNAIAPGPILPPPDLDANDHRAVEEATPLGRWGGELEIAKAVIGLLDSDFITGETVRVDGGRHVK